MTFKSADNRFLSFDLTRSCFFQTNLIPHRIGKVNANNFPFQGLLRPVAVFRTGVRGARLVPRESREPRNLCDVHRSAKPTVNFRHWVWGGTSKLIRRTS
ncbi:hypothetical protein AVEN_81089-1 [Araneus ventricosus]|uniref:Uncharacterized protein n=1 Tax=Araneus ventricosus TaxID=182803 RepID=A0A4Y2STE3_ARAVE|nr:hypothetical protein AVEN_81089-1 [Araneus ventricosus]